MGSPNYDLVPAAILYSNPGVSLNEFNYLLNEVRCSGIWSCRKNAPWNSTGRSKYPNGEETMFHRGVYGLARDILGFPLKEDFKNYAKPVLDLQGIPLHPVYVHDVPLLKKGKWVEPRIEVHFHRSNRCGKIEEVDDYSAEKHNVGEIWRDSDSFKEGLIMDIKVEEDLEKEDSEHDPNGQFKYFYKLMVKPFKRIKEIKRFDSYSEFSHQFPRFSLENMFDLNAKTGAIWPGNLRNSAFIGGPFYLWKQNEGKFYFDDISMDQMGFKGSRFTDLIMTSEVIRQKAWKFLCYDGSREVKYLEVKSTKTWEAHQKAVFDLWTSELAAREKMSNFDLMRFRLLNPQKPSKLNPKLKKAMLNEQLEEILRHCPDPKNFEKDDIPF